LHSIEVVTDPELSNYLLAVYLSILFGQGDLHFSVKLQKAAKETQFFAEFALSSTTKKGVKTDDFGANPIDKP